MANRVWAGPADQFGRPLIQEALAADVDCFPGNAVGYSSGKFDNLAAAEEGQQVLIVRDDPYSTDPMNAASVTDETLQAVQPRSGELVNVRLSINQTIVKGDPLALSVIPGRFKKGTPGTDVTLLIAQEDVTTGGSSTDFVLALKV